MSAVPSAAWPHTLPSPRLKAGATGMVANVGAIAPRVSLPLAPRRHVLVRSAGDGGGGIRQGAEAVEVGAGDVEVEVFAHRAVIDRLQVLGRGGFVAGEQGPLAEVEIRIEALAGAVLRGRGGLGRLLDRGGTALAEEQIDDQIGRAHV